jgi:3-oxoacyl-[acyl-carrier protein] reductase
MHERTAIVTGSTSGIGREVAMGLLEEGYTVLVTGRRAALLEDVLEKARKNDLKAISHLADLSTEEGILSLIRKGQSALPHIDILVNNAGGLVFAPIENITDKDYETLMSVNLRAPFLLSRAFLPEMKKRGSGLIVNISSVAGTEAWEGSSLYSMTKFALRGLTGSLLAEGAPHGVKAFAICPGYVATPMVSGAPVPLKEMIQPNDILKTIRYVRDLSPYAVSPEILLNRLGAFS